MREKLIELYFEVQQLRYLRKGIGECVDILISNGVTIPVRCKECKHSKLPAVLTQKYGKQGTLTCHNWHSPCNKRNVNADDYCSRGERRTEDQ